MFVDGTNMFYAQRKLGFHIDYKKLYSYFSRGNPVYNAFYYTGRDVPPDQTTIAFLDALTYMGYTLRTKDIKTITDEDTGETVRKCDLDVEIVIDMFNCVDLYDIAVLCSGDGDFTRAVEMLRSNGKEIWACSCKGMAATELVNAVDKFFWLEKMEKEIRKGNNMGRSGGSRDEDGAFKDRDREFERPSRERVRVYTDD